MISDFSIPWIGQITAAVKKAGVSSCYPVYVQCMTNPCRACTRQVIQPVVVLRNHISLFRETS